MVKYIVRKAYFDYEKEEKYLNSMSAKGLALTDYSWCRYVFEDAPRGEYIYRIELLENPVNHPESQNYIRFMEETGIEFVASYNRWVYFRRKAADGAFDIYSDIDSKIKHFKRIRALFSLGMVLGIIAGCINLLLEYTVDTEGIPPMNLYTAIYTLTISALLFIFLVIPVSKRIRALKKEKEIRE